jgi:Na+-translocating ferredoxin:NAD+ oxidoreductase RnfG subunit
MITGATISSRTIIRTINNAIERFGPMFDAYDEGTGP